MKIEKHISKVGLAFTALYLGLYLIGYMDFFECNGWQFHTVHGKCTGMLLFALFAISPINIPIVLLMEKIGFGTEDLSVFFHYFRDFVLIILNSILIYFLGYWVQENRKRRPIKK